MFRAALRRLHEDERGHAGPLLTWVVGAAGAIVLTVGAVAERDAVVIVGGVLVALGFVGAGALTHVLVDYGILARLDALEQGRSTDSAESE